MKALVLTLALSLCGLDVFANEFSSGERVGTFELSEILLRPTYFSRESEGGEFSLGDTSIRFKWTKDRHLSAHLGLGSLKERSVPRYYNSTEPEDTLGIYEAYVEYQGIYGRLRMGILPLNFGYEGYLPNASLSFQRSQLYLDRYVIYRDFGFSVYSEHNGYYTELIGHNGEGSQSDQDGNIWATARWGWTNHRHTIVQLSAQAGRTTSDSTSSNGVSGFMGFDKDQSAIWRIMALSWHYYPRQWEVALQLNYGELKQDPADGSFSGEQLDVLHFFKSGWGVGLRYDHLDPDREVSNDAITNSSFAVVFGERDATNRFYVIATKRELEGSSAPSDELRLIWRVTPYN